MLGCSYDAAQIRGKSSTWLSKKLVETTNPSLQLLLIKEMEQRKDPSHLVQLVRFAGDSNKAISKAAFSALLSYDGRFEERDAFYLQMLDGPNLQFQRMATRGISDRFLAQEQILAPKTFAGAKNVFGAKRNCETIVNLSRNKDVKVPS